MNLLILVVVFLAAEVSNGYSPVPGSNAAQPGQPQIGQTQPTNQAQAQGQGQGQSQANSQSPEANQEEYEKRDPIALLSSCGSECWSRGNSNPEVLNTKPELFDVPLVKCMQACFSRKTQNNDNEQNLPPEQVKKIKVSAHCGHVCWPNNKKYKKALDYCYAGCLGTVLQQKN